MKSLFTIGKIVYAIPLFMFGLFHMMNGSDMAGMISGFPAAEFFVYLSGVGLMAAAVSIVINVYAKLASLLLALLMLLIIGFVWLPQMGDPEMGQNAMTMVMKDSAILGGALFLAGYFGKKES